MDKESEARNPGDREAARSDEVGAPDDPRSKLREWLGIDEPSGVGSDDDDDQEEDQDGTEESSGPEGIADYGVALRNIGLAERQGFDSIGGGRIGGYKRGAAFKRRG